MALSLINKFLNKGQERSVEAKKNILSMIFLKGGSILIGLLLIPLTIDYVDAETYGLWLAISSIVGWMSFLDIGLNNGLRNKFTEAKANGNTELAQKYVSTTYSLLVLIFVPILFIFLLVNPYIEWAAFLNIHSKSAQKLGIVMLIVFAHFCIKFVLSTINVVFIADQKPAKASLTLLVEQALSLLFIFILTKTTEGSLMVLCVTLCSTPIIVLLFFNIFSFRHKYKDYAPKISMIDVSLFSDLFSLGFRFFVIQIASIVQYETCNFIILKYFGGIEVTAYNISYKYFSVLLLVMNILLAPLWSSVTDAYVKKDFVWISQMIKKYLLFFGLLCIAGVFMLFASNWVYHIWLGKNYVAIPFVLSMWVFIYSITLSFASIFVMTLNGMGKLNIQFYASFVSPIVFVGLSYYLIKYYNVSVYVIVVVSVISNFNGILLAPLQLFNELKNLKKK